MKKHDYEVLVAWLIQQQNYRASDLHYVREIARMVSFLEAEYENFARNTFIDAVYNKLDDTIVATMLLNELET